MAQRSRESTVIEAGGLRAELVRSRRKTISLQIMPDLGLLVRAPLGSPESFIRDFLLRRRDWVERHRARLAELRASDPQPLWKTGESLPFLGGRLELRIEVGARSSARLAPPLILVTVKEPGEGEEVRRAVERLYAREAAIRFPRLLDACMSKAAAHRLPRPELRLRSMKSRWGSCDTTRKAVTLNTRLMRFHAEVIEYVIMHELAHLRHRAHDARFYGLLEKLCPEWRRLRNLLSDVYLE